MQYDDRTEVRNTKAQKRRWRAASQLRTDGDLTEWIRVTLDAQADDDLSSPRK